MTTTNVHPLLQAILENPGDNTIRLIFADWLEEHGDPLCDFIRVQVELAGFAQQRYSHSHTPELPCCQIEALRRRERKLLIANWKQWYTPFPTNTNNCGNITDAILPTGGPTNFFRRGFVDEIHCRLVDWIKHGSVIVSRQPITRVLLTDRRPHEAVRGLGSGWYASSDRGVSPQAVIPGEWWDRTADLAGRVKDPHERLSIVAIDWARRQATLPELMRTI